MHHYSFLTHPNRILYSHFTKLMLILIHRVKLCELREYKWNEYVTIAVELQVKQLQSNPKKRFLGLQRDSNAWPTVFVLPYSTSWAMKTQTYRINFNYNKRSNTECTDSIINTSNNKKFNCTTLYICNRIVLNKCDCPCAIKSLSLLFFLWGSFKGAFILKFELKAINQLQYRQATGNLVNNFNLVILGLAFTTV